jgi:hypothetical protein
MTTLFWTSGWMTLPSEDKQDEIAHPPDKQQQGQGGDRDEQPLDEEPVPWDEPSRSPIGCGVHPAAAGAAAEDVPASSERIISRFAIGDQARREAGPAQRVNPLKREGKEQGGGGGHHQGREPAQRGGGRRQG